MKKRIARVRFWLDRLSAACESGRWDSAAIEADSLTAEARQIRDDLWEKAGDAAVNDKYRNSRRQLSFWLKSATVAAAIVLAATFPVALESERPLRPVAKSGPEVPALERLSWVSAEEEELLKMLRAELNKNSGAIEVKEIKAAKAPVKRAPQRPKAEPEKAAESKTVPVVAPLTKAPAVKEPKVEEHAGLNEEDMISLLEIGQKALKGGKPAIKIVRE